MEDLQYKRVGLPKLHFGLVKCNFFLAHELVFLAGGFDAAACRAKKQDRFFAIEISPLPCLSCDLHRLDPERDLPAVLLPRENKTKKHTQRREASFGEIRASVLGEHSLTLSQNRVAGCYEADRYQIGDIGDPICCASILITQVKA